MYVGHKISLYIKSNESPLIIACQRIEEMRIKKGDMGKFLFNRL
jgi:hypothetical protein